MMDRHLFDGKACCCFRSDLREDRLGHCRVRFILERRHGAAARIVANAPNERHDTASIWRRDERSDRMFGEWLAADQKWRAHPPAMGGSTASSSPSWSVDVALTCVWLIANAALCASGCKRGNVSHSCNSTSAA